jgi:hypothetical protein
MVVEDVPGSVHRVRVLSQLGCGRRGEPRALGAESLVVTREARSDLPPCDHRSAPR